METSSEDNPFGGSATPLPFVGISVAMICKTIQVVKIDRLSRCHNIRIATAQTDKFRENLNVFFSCEKCFRRHPIEMKTLNGFTIKRSALIHKPNLKFREGTVSTHLQAYPAKSIIAPTYLKYALQKVR
jgi:hypothetical protein